MKVIDTHQHLWDINRFRYSWCRELPSLNRSFDIEDYRKESNGLLIEKTVLIECAVDEPHAMDEMKYFTALAQSSPLIAGIVVTCRPERDGFAEYLEKLSAMPLIKGVRRVLHVEPDEVSQTDLFANNLRLLSGYGLSFDLCVLSRQLPLAVALVRKCPSVSFILDHCGIPPIKDGAFDPWRNHIVELAQQPNVVCKISGLAVCADLAHWTPEDLRPWVDHVIAHFGWDRIMWGGDWPVCRLATSLGRWLETAKNLVGNASVAQQTKLFYANAQRIYRLA